MKFFEITKITHKGTTGKRLGVVKATSQKSAINILQQHKKLPKKVRVFPVELTKSKNPNKLLRIYKPLKKSRNKEKSIYNLFKLN